MYSELDTFVLIPKYWIRSSTLDKLGPCFKLGFVLVRCVQVIQILQWSHFFSMVFCVMTVGAHSALSCASYFVKTARQLSNLIRAQVILGRHKALEIILLMGTEITYFASFGTMIAGFLLDVGFNYICLKMHGIFPLPIYGMCIICAVVIPCAASIMLPMLINLYIMDKEVHRVWRLSGVRCSEYKLLKRQLRATKVLRYYAGMLGHVIFELNGEIKASYYYGIVSYTTTFVLSLDPVLIQKRFLKV